MKQRRTGHVYGDVEMDDVENGDEFDDEEGVWDESDLEQNAAGF